MWDFADLGRVVASVAFGAVFCALSAGIRMAIVVCEISVFLGSSAVAVRGDYSVAFDSFAHKAS